MSETLNPGRLYGNSPDEGRASIPQQFRRRVSAALYQLEFQAEAV